MVKGSSLKYKAKRFIWSMQTLIAWLIAISIVVGILAFALWLGIHVRMD